MTIRGHHGILLNTTGVVATAHRYWRISISANNGGAYMGFTEIELRGAVDGPDLTASPIGGPWDDVCQASSQVNLDNRKAYAIDNSLARGWLSANASPAWWYYDFGYADAGWTALGPQSIKQVALRGSWNTNASSPRDFTIDWSDDGSSWTTALAVSGQTGWYGANDLRTFSVP